MTTEVELKFAVPPRVLRDASRLPWLQKLATGPVGRKKLVSVYFDTAKFKLRDHGLTLRIRKDGRRRLQTVKAIANDGSGRQEWEEEVSAPKPDLKLARRTALAPLVSTKLKRSLRPIFETEVQRTVMPLRIGDSDLELALDRGHIKASEGRAEISEIELELKHGDRADLARLARRLADAIPITYGARTKPERGYALSAGEQDHQSSPPRSRLARKASTADAFSAIGLSCLHHLAANQDAVRQGDPEGVHQMRVGVRRLRAAISIFKESRTGHRRRQDQNGTQVARRAARAGAGSRCHGQGSVTPLREASPDTPEIKLLEADLNERREGGFDQAKAAVAGDRYRTVVLTTALWLINGEWLKTADPLIAPGVTGRRKPSRGMSCVIARRRSSKGPHGGENGRARSPQVANCRQEAALRGGLLRQPVRQVQGQKARKRFENPLKTLQDALGTLNDMAVHEKLAGQFTNSRRPGRNDRERHLPWACWPGANSARRAPTLPPQSRLTRNLPRRLPSGASGGDNPLSQCVSV